MFANWFRRDKVSDAPGPTRWVVLDTETTGLNVRHDRLISIAAVAVHVAEDLSCARICLADSFEAIIQQDGSQSSKQNILIHHIGVAAQSGGQALESVLAEFAQWVGDAPLFAYHAEFDAAMIRGAFKSAGLPPLPNRWTDVAPLTNCVVRDIPNAALDQRIAQFGLQCIARHDAAADTFVTAELLLRLLPTLRQQAKSYADLVQLAVAHTRQ